MPNAHRSGAARKKAQKARQSTTDGNGSSNFTPTGDFSFNPSSTSSSFSNTNGKKNGFSAPTSSTSSSSDDSDADSVEEDDDDSDVIIEKPDSELSEPERISRALEKKDLGNVSYKKADYPTATRYYTHAITLDPTNSSYLLNRAAAKMGSKLFSAALEDCLAAQAIQGKDKSSAGGIQAKTYLRTAKCQLALGLIGPAQQSLQEAFRLEPSNRAIVTEKSKADRIAGHVERLKENLEKKDWSMVLLGVDAAVRELGEGATPREWRGWKVEALVGKKRYDEAAGLAADLLRLDPKQPEPLYLRGICLYFQGQHEQAIAHCKSCLTNDPDFSKARTLMKKIRALDALKEAGNTAFKGQQTQEAIDKYTEAIEFDPENESMKTVLLSNRAAAHLRAKDYPSAISDCTSCLSLNSSYFKALRTRARAYLAQEEFEDAVRDFKAAFELAPSGSNDETMLKKEVREAEQKLKKSKMKDHYKILGVHTEATEKEIKVAYRKASLIHHPDKGGSDEKFQEIGESYAILSDPERRRKFDMGIDESDPHGGMDHDHFGGGMGGMGGMGGGFTMDDLFGGGGGGGFGGGGYGGSPFGGGGRRGGGYNSYGF
ncbi:hypothetical protein JCM16303_001241 [Sporobolomyces ruberrimus]